MRPSLAKGGWKFVVAMLLLLYAGVNVFIVIIGAIPPYNASDGTLSAPHWNTTNENRTVTCSGAGHAINITFPYPVSIGNGSAFRGFYLPATTFGLILLGTCYYFLMFGKEFFSDSMLFRYSLLDLAGVDCNIQKQDRYYPQREEVRRFGRRRTIEYLVSKPPSNSK
jgi:hypothetical protein